MARRGTVAGGALGACLIAAALFLLSAAASNWPKALPIALSAAALAALLAAWFLWSRRLLPALSALASRGEAAREQIGKLSMGMAKLSTGDLAAVVDLPAAVEGGRPPRPLAPLSEAIEGIAAGVRESIDGFDEITDDPCLRSFYVGSDSYEEGLAAGEAIGGLLKGKGRFCAILGDFLSVNYKLRLKGVVARLAERYPGIELVGTAATRESAEETYAAVQGFLKERPDLECVYVAEGSTPQLAAKAVEDSGRARKTVVVCHDTTDETMEFVAKGVIGATISQDPYAQGYDPVIRLYNMLASGWAPSVPRLLTRLGTVTPENYQRYWSREKGADYSDRSHLAKAAARAPGRDARFRIAVVCSSGEGFWAHVRRGALDAKAELEGLGAEVEWITPPRELDNDRSAATYAPILDRLVAEGRQAIAIPIFTRALVATINKAARSGVAVASFNSEPVSLREMVTSVKAGSDSLIELSQELAASAEESGQSTKRIGETMDRIGASVESQLLDVSRTSEELQALIANIRKVNEATEESAESARGVAASSNEGFLSVSEMRKTVKALEEASSTAESTIRSLREDTGRIGAIVGTIAEISNQTNVLAINASIQAARAGEQGKGFAVIAAEIRKLADQSNRSAQEIALLVNQVKGRVDNATEATGRGLARARENSAHAELSEKSLRDISALAAENERRMAVIRSAVEDIARFSERVEGTVRSLTETNKRSEEASVEVRGSTQEMAAQSADVARAAQALARMAQDQKVLLSQFRVDEER